jgi:opacity protein-like surface antigen
MARSRSSSHGLEGLVRGRLTLGFTLLVATLAAAPAAAQGPPATTIFGGYGWLHESGIGGSPSVNYGKGWVVSVAQRMTPVWLAIAGEAGGQYRTTSAIETHSLYGFLGGLRIGLTRGSRLSTFAQVLAGVERFSSPGFSEAGFAFQPGAGLDVALHKRVAVRMQGDFRLAHEEGVTFKEARVAVGIVVGLGR